MITNAQYLNICLDSLGLRSNDTANVAKLEAASYSMCLAKADPMDLAAFMKEIRKGVPAEWDAVLNTTIQTILSFSNSATRVLAIVSPSSGRSYEYTGCFPKSSVKPTAILASIQIDSDATIEQLVQWVEKTIP